MRRISRFNMALMLALAGTTAVSLALPVDGAFAQRAEKKGKKGKDEAPQMELSAEFRNAFSAAQTAFGASDFVTAEAKLNEAAAVAASADEKYLTGKLTLQIGLKKNDEATQMKGIEQALASMEKTKAERKFALHGQLARWYWELAYVGLAQGSVLEHVLQQAWSHVGTALQGEPSGEMHLLAGRIAMELGNLDEASSQFEQAAQTGTGAAQLAPYQAEIAFRRQRYDEIPQMLASMPADMLQRPPFAALAKYWL